MKKTELIIPLGLNLDNDNLHAIIAKKNEILSRYQEICINHRIDVKIDTIYQKGDAFCKLTFKNVSDEYKFFLLQ